MKNLLLQCEEAAPAGSLIPDQCEATAAGCEVLMWREERERRGEESTAENLKV